MLSQWEIYERGTGARKALILCKKNQEISEGRKADRIRQLRVRISH